MADGRYGHAYGTDAVTFGFPDTGTLPNNARAAVAPKSKRTNNEKLAALSGAPDVDAVRIFPALALGVRG